MLRRLCGPPSIPLSFSLAGWTPQIQTYFHVSGLTQVPVRPLSPVAYGTITLYGRTFQNDSARVLAF